MPSVKAYFFLSIIAFLFSKVSYSQSEEQKDEITTIILQETEKEILIDKLIYGEMLEVCNDRIIYDGIVNKDGSRRLHVDELIKELQIPVMRWPGGTYVKEYHWEDGIGPVDQRKEKTNHAWGGKDSHRFGTDEFLHWSEDVHTQPYINFNMGNTEEFGGSLQEALNWIAYVNGADTTDYGRKRAMNGRKEPYQVKYWGLGNEDYLTTGITHTGETAEQYAKKLDLWGKEIKRRHPELSLLGVGHTKDWDATVLQNAGAHIDFLTQHYYVKSEFKNGRIQNPLNSLFAPLKMENHLLELSEIISKYNEHRTGNPLRISIDEWDNRHHLWDGEKYYFDRQNARTQFDAAVVAGMLNVFIRQSPLVGMANYIFPVNSHGVIKTIGDEEAYKSAIYPIFKQYREWMTGRKMDFHLQGPEIAISRLDFFLDGDADETRMQQESFSYIDAGAVMNEEGNVVVSVVNRDVEKERKVEITIPFAYKEVEIWTLESTSIHAANTENNRDHLQPVVERFQQKGTSLSIDLKPCAVKLIRFFP